MNILWLNHHAGSLLHGMEYRTYYLSREWARLGHQVTIITSEWSHLRRYNPSIAHDWSTDTIDGIHYVWLKVGRYRDNGLDRLASMLRFVSKCSMRSRYIAHAFCPDVVITASTYVMDTWAGHRIARIAEAVYIHEVRDLWPLTLTEIGGHSPYHPFVRIIQMAEEFAYRNADLVVTTLSDSFEHMRNHGLTRDRFWYAPNGISLEEWNTATPAPEHIVRSIDSLKNSGLFVIGYTGGHSVSNSIDTLLSAANVLKNSPVAFVLVGEGFDKSGLRNRVKNERVVFFDAIAKECIPATLARMDAVWLGWRRSPIYRYGIAANKLYDYAMAARPILHSCDYESDLVSLSGCGFRVPAEDPQALTWAITKLMQLPWEVRQQMGSRGRQYVVDRHDYRVIASQLVALFHSLRECHASRRQSTLAH